MAILEVNHIEKNFGNTKVLEDVGFSLEEGKALAIIGSSGSGKTTLLRCLNFLETPDGGTISVRGEVLFDGSVSRAGKERDLRKKRLHFGMVFQSFHLFPQYTALENVMLAEQMLAREREDFKQNKKEILEEIRKHGVELLIRMGLQERMEHYPHQLSGGQQQRVAIARAIAQAPPVILADEPTGNLDSGSSKEIIQILKELHKEGRTVILITHDNEIAAQAKRVIRIKDGKIERDYENEMD